MTNAETRNFDQESATWDENPARRKLAKEIAHALSSRISLTSDMEIMDFGCGTGLLTLQLQPLVRAVTGVDQSRGMLDVLNKKIAGSNLKNVNTLLVDLDKGDTLKGKYNIVVSSMTLHHVRDITLLFAQFHDTTAPEGYLCIADLDAEDGQFHGNNTGVFHFGFDRTALRKIFEQAGFRNIKDSTAAEIAKPAHSGEMRRFTVFLMTGQRTADERKQNPQ